MSNWQRRDFGRGNQRWTPGWAEWGTRQSDGRESIVYGRTGEHDPHGHTIRDGDGSLIYNRGLNQDVRIDRK